MKERPILFSGEMVRAILDGRKTQTRRVIKIQPQPVNIHNVRMRDEAPGTFGWWDCSGEFHPVPCTLESREDECIISRYGYAGDRLWVREKFIAGFETDDYGNLRCFDNDGNDLPPTVWYAAGPLPENFCWMSEDGSTHENSRGEETIPWKPSIHMPRWASRITLEIKSIRVERLRDITEEDARAEGVEKAFGHHERGAFLGIGECYREGFAQLWADINGKKHGRTWHDNPWIWAITFERCDA